MEKLVLLLLVLPWLGSAEAMDAVNDTKLLPANSSDPKKDMYVIHAMVYQVGIVTNKTDNETGNMNATGNQEAVTFFHSNGSQGLDLSKIPTPLLTNVTAQSMVGVAPMAVNSENAPNQLPWSTLNHLTNVFPPSALAAPEELLNGIFCNCKNGCGTCGSRCGCRKAGLQCSLACGSEPLKMSKRSVRSIDIIDSDTDDKDVPFNEFYKSLFKREVSSGETPVAIHSGAAVIPQSAGVQSIGIPPLITLNNNMSDIPVPIPNASVVHYSKINTLVTKS